MNNNVNGKPEWHTIVIGAGQAGLAAGYFLSRSGTDFLILDGNHNVGDSWRNRWDSLRLFTPSQFDGLPGHPFPSARNTFPSKDEMADYLADYREKFNLPVKFRELVTTLSRSNTGFELNTASGIYKCRNVIVATGTNPVPRIPEFAADVEKGIHQIHSSRYVNPDSLPEGDVLVVGAGTSGMEIAIELSGSRKTMISGLPNFHIPDPLLRYGGNLYWWLISNVLTVNTPIGRKAKGKILKGGGPLINVSVRDLLKAGVKQIPRVVGVEDGRPKLADSTTVNVSSIVWATGFKPDFSWIDLRVTDEESGWPVTKRGVSTEVKGLYFLGMLFQFGLTSGLVGGVGRDAAYVVDHIDREVAAVATVRL